MVAWTPALSQWASTFALSDVWCQFHTSDREFICHSTYCTFSCIDLCYASPSALQWVNSADILSRSVSDHAPLLVGLQLAAPVGQGMWRQTRFCLSDPTVQENIPEALCRFWLENEDTANSLLVWD